MRQTRSFHYIFSCVLVLFFLCDNDGFAGDNIWTFLGPNYSDNAIYSIAINPQNPSTIYIGTKWYGFFKSTDSGQNWTHIYGWPTLPPAANDIAVDPMNPEIIYAGDSINGLAISTDGGANWTTAWMNPAFPSSVYTIAIADADPNVIYVGSNNGIYKSIDAGTNWIHVNSSLFLVNQLLSHPNDADIVYASDVTQVIYKSTDGGINWLDLGIEDVYAIAMESTNPDVIYVGTDNGLRKSTDGGQNWSFYSIEGVKYSSFSVEKMVVDPVDNDTIYCNVRYLISGGGSEYDLLKSVDGGITWNSIGAGLDELHIRDIAINPSDSNTIYVGTYGKGIYRSINGGSDWNESSTGLPSPIYDIAIDPNNANNMYIAKNSGIHKSTDGGANWAITDSIGDTYRIAVSSSSPDTLYYNVYQNRALFKSINAGDQWEFIKEFPNYIQVIIIHPENPDIVYIGTSTMGSGDGGIFKTIDGGITWNQMNSGLASLYILALAIDPFNTDTVYAGTRDEGLFKSVDGGLNWNSVDSMASGTISDIEINQISPEILFILTGAELYKLNGSNKTLLNSSVSKMAVSPTNPDIIYIQTPLDNVIEPDPNVFMISLDGGQSWSDLNDGLDIKINRISSPYTNLGFLAINPQNSNKVYTGSKGVWEYTYQGQLKGDIDSDGDRDLADLILILKILVDQNISTNIDLNADVNNDGKIALEDALFVLHNLSK